MLLWWAHLAGFIHGACDYEGAIPIKLNIADFTPVTNQSADTSEKHRKQQWFSRALLYAECLSFVHVLYNATDDMSVQKPPTHTHSLMHTLQ